MNHINITTNTHANADILQLHISDDYINSLGDQSTHNNKIQQPTEDNTNINTNSNTNLNDEKTKTKRKRVHGIGEFPN